MAKPLKNGEAKAPPADRVPEAAKPAETTAVAARSGLTGISLEGASPRLKEALLEVQDNLASVDSFQIPRIKASAAGLLLAEGEKPVTELEGVIIHARKQNAYYAKPYNKNEVVPPDCFSNDGVKPDAGAKAPQHATCNGCPKAEFGTNSMGSGKACRNMKPLYLLLSDDSIIPRQLTITPTSLRAANGYFMDLTERGIAYRKVKTKFTTFKDDEGDTYVKFRFTRGEKLTPERMADVEVLRRTWLPVMDAQLVDQREVNEGAATPADSKGEY
jgi:hypothetical protein